ncbi:MAG: hypothetical protein WBG57_03995, partial [Ornithinimicrobium sp.]
NDQTELFTQAIISNEVVRRDETTLAVRLGPYLEPVASAVLALTLGATLLGRARSAKKDP